MKFGDYAVKTGRTVDEVRNALQQTGQPLHPNRHVDEAALDAYFAGSWTPPETLVIQEVPSVGALQESPVVEREVSEDDPSLKQRQRDTSTAQDIPKVQRSAPPMVLGKYQRGMLVFTMEPRGAKCPLPVVPHKAYGFDSSEAISVILKHYKVTSSELITWHTLGTEKPQTLIE